MKTLMYALIISGLVLGSSVKCAEPEPPAAISQQQRVLVEKNITHSLTSDVLDLRTGAIQLVARRVDDKHANLLRFADGQRAGRRLVRADALPPGRAVKDAAGRDCLVDRDRT